MRKWSGGMRGMEDYRTLSGRRKKINKNKIERDPPL